MERFQKVNEMTEKELFTVLREKFLEIVKANKCDLSGITISAKALSPEEAIGITKRKGYPILDGAEIMLKAEYKGCIGQAFTSNPAEYSGSLDDIINGDIIGDLHARALFIASMNAVMKYLGLIGCTIHCRNDGPELCADEFIPYLKETYGNPKILQVGYQPALFQQLAENFEMRILDLNPVNVGKEIYGVTVEHGINDKEDAMEWADLILCTGSTLANGSIVDFIDIGKEVVFYGTTVAGAAEILGLKRACFQSL